MELPTESNDYGTSRGKIGTFNNDSITSLVVVP